MIKYNDILNNNFVLSPHQLHLMEYENKNSLKLNELLKRDLDKSDNGTDVGSNNYMKYSNYIFLKTKVANKEHFIIDTSSKESYEYINFNAFINQNLKQGDILISKDSNIGECCILDKDYPNCMMASAFYKLPLSKNKYYILAFMKTKHFKSQLDLMVPRGATIRHAGKRFLECKIPFPNKKEADKIIPLIEFLVKYIIKKEQQIINNENKIFEIIDNELKNNSFVSKYSMPRYKELVDKNRIDAGYYCDEYQKINSIIKNYKNGYSTLNDFGYNISRGQNLQVSCIGKSIETSEFKEGFYKIAKPTNLSDYGTVTSYNYLGNKKDLSLLKNGDIVFSAEGTIGKCAMFSDISNEKIITNIHGIILNKTNHDIIESGYVCSFLRYLRKVGYFNYLSVGGQGGSLAMKYWDDVIIPLFPESLIKKISKLYCQKSNTKEDLINYKNYDYSINENMSIIELSNQISNTKNTLNCIFDKIVENEFISYDEVINIIKENIY